MSYSAVSGKIVGVGLGKPYTITTNLPLQPTMTLDIPIEQIVPDALDVAQRDIGRRLWPLVPYVAIGVAVVGAGVIAWRSS